MFKRDWGHTKPNRNYTPTEQKTTAWVILPIDTYNETTVKIQPSPLKNVLKVFLFIQRFRKLETTNIGYK